MNEDQLRNTIRRLVENDPTLTTLDLRDVVGYRSFVFGSDGNVSVEELVQALSVNTTVTSVSIVLRFLGKLTFEEQRVIFRAIGSLPNLQELRITSMGFANSALKLVDELLLQSASKANNLEVLTLQSMQFRGRIYYDNEADINTDTDELRDFLATLTKLTNLKSFVFTDAQTTFDLNAVVLQGLATLTSLKRVGISSHEFPDSPRLFAESLSALAALPNIEWLSLRRLHLNPLLPDFLANLTHHACLKTLILNQNMIGEETAIALSNLIRRHAVLEDVYLSHNLIPDHSGAFIAEALSESTSMVELDMAANEVGAMSCQAFARALESPTCSLEYLNLSQHRIPAEGIEQIATALRNNFKLKSIALMEVQMTEDGGITMANALMENSTLERLNLSDNKLGNRACVEFAKLLRTRATLKSLNLCTNRVTSPGAILLADALLVNSTLEQLNLVNNHAMGEIAYDAFEVMIQDNTAMQHLWLPTVLPNSTIPSFIRLNKLGRKALIQDMNNAEEWLYALSKCQDDLPALYCLIRTNPNVVSWMV